MKSPYYHAIDNSIHMTHSSGFFSCCSVRLEAIITFFNENNFNLPDSVNTLKSFEWYKKNKNEDVIFEFFENYDNISINFNNTIVDYQQTYQWIDYNKLDLKHLLPFVKKYFTPSKNIYNIVQEIEEKYNIVDYNNICTLFYRGNDKIGEANYRNKKITPYNAYISKARELFKTNPNIKFLIQSDETNFIETMCSEFPNSFYFKDEIRHMNNSKSTVDKVFKNTHEFSKNFLAITLIMAKCKYIICGTGNCSIWMTFFRENTENVIQLSPN